MIQLVKLVVAFPGVLISGPFAANVEHVHVLIHHHLQGLSSPAVGAQATWAAKEGVGSLGHHTPVGNPSVFSA